MSRCMTDTALRKQPRVIRSSWTALGTAIAITDECSMAGIVRAHVAAKEQGIRLLVGSQFEVDCAFPHTLVVYACNLNGYGNRCQLISKLRRSSEKGTYAAIGVLRGDPADVRCVPRAEVRQ